MRAPRAENISSSLDRIDNAIESLDGIVGRIRERIYPVLHQHHLDSGSMEQPRNDKEPDSRSELNQALSSRADRLNLILAQLHEMDERIDL